MSGRCRLVRRLAQGVLGLADVEVEIIFDLDRLIRFVQNGVASGRACVKRYRTGLLEKRVLVPLQFLPRLPLRVFVDVHLGDLLRNDRCPEVDFGRGLLDDSAIRQRQLRSDAPLPLKLSNLHRVRVKHKLRV